MSEGAQFNEIKERARAQYQKQRDIYCPYFAERIELNSDGFRHLQYSSQGERSKAEQQLKFRLLPYALEVIRRSGTVQEYRTMLKPSGKPGKRDGMTPMKEIAYWGFVALLGAAKRPVKVRVVLRRIGNGNITFWSVM